MKRLKKIILQPRSTDPLFVMQILALTTCARKQCDVEFEFNGSTFRVEWDELSELCRKVPKTPRIGK